jgi:hypothetical protein
MKLAKYVFSAIALAAAAGPAMAGCTSTSSLGTLGPPGFSLFGNDFSSAGSYSDCYTFNLLGNATSFGGTLELDPWLNKLDIDLTSITLSGGTLGSMLTDTTPSSFAFGSLGAGSYTLTVNAVVQNAIGLFNTSVYYGGSITTLAAAIPEPGTYALMLAGLGALGWVARRRRVI